MSRPDTERDERWVEGVRAGETEAFEALFRAYRDELCDFLCSYVHSAEIAEDLVHDIFLDLWDRRCDWHPKGTVEAYLYCAARNTAFDWLDHRRVSQEWEAEERRREPFIPESPAGAAEYRELTQAMQQAIAALPERRRLVYRMVRQQGLSYKEVASALDISAKTVENQMRRAQKFLRTRLAAFQEEP